MVLKSVGVLSAGKISGAICALIGLFLGAFMSLMSVLGVVLQQQGQGNAQAVPALFLGIGALVFIPIFYGIFGFITGVIYAAVYNLIAGLVGGIEMNFERTPGVVLPQ